MTTLTFKIPVEVSASSILTDNWRFMTSTRYNYGNNSWTSGTKIVLQDGTIDVMGYDPHMIRDIIYRNENVDNVIFTRNGYEAPGFCYKCGGRGLIDWVTSAMGDRRERYGRYSRLFERDERYILFYQSGNNQYRFEKVFARTKLEDGYRHCKNCHGTGLALDARQRIFAGMPGIKRKLRTFEWDGLNIPG